MPKKQRRRGGTPSRQKLTSDRARRYIDAFRSGSPHLRRALARLREAESQSVLTAVLDRVDGRPKLKKHLVGTPFVKTFASLGERLRFQSTGSVNRETLWHASVILRYLPALNEFLDRKEQFERAVLLRKFDEAGELRDAIRENYGESLWSLETGLLLAEKTGGIEANRRFLASILDSASDGVVQLLAQFWSQRVENDLSAGTYIHSVNSFLGHQADLGTDAGLLHYLELKLKGGGNTTAVCNDRR